jgi:hypothetical protein
MDEPNSHPPVPARAKCRDQTNGALRAWARRPAPLHGKRKPRFKEKAGVAKTAALRWKGAVGTSRWLPDAAGRDSSQHECDDCARSSGEQLEEGRSGRCFRPEPHALAQPLSCFAERRSMERADQPPFGAYEKGSGYGLNRALTWRAPASTPYKPASQPPFRIQSSEGAVVGRYRTRREALQALPDAERATGLPCRIVS